MGLVYDASCEGCGYSATRLTSGFDFAANRQVMNCFNCRETVSVVEGLSPDLSPGTRMPPVGKCPNCGSDRIHALSGGQGLSGGEVSGPCPRCGTALSFTAIGMAG